MAGAGRRSTYALPARLLSAIITLVAVAGVALWIIDALSTSYAVPPEVTGAIVTLISLAAGGRLAAAKEEVADDDEPHHG